VLCVAAKEVSRILNKSGEAKLRRRAMNLSEMFRNQVVTVEPTDSILAAVEKMQQKNVGAVVVVKEGKVAGILTDRDVALKLGLGKAGRETPVSDVMTQNVTTIWDDQGVFNATQYLRGKKVRRLPIIDRQERLIGMVTLDDLFALLARELLNVAQSLEKSVGTNV
jgi:CBS domain-containing protein